MRIPSRVRARLVGREQKEIMHHEGSRKVWVPARPLPYPHWTERWLRAWDVLTGKADAIYWEGQ